MDLNYQDYSIKIIQEPFFFQATTQSNNILQQLKAYWFFCKVVGVFSPPYFYLQQPIKSPQTFEFHPLIQSIFTSIFHFLTCLQNHRYNPHQYFFPLYLSHFYLSIFTCSHPYRPHQKHFPLPRPFSQFIVL